MKWTDLLNLCGFKTFEKAFVIFSFNFFLILAARGGWVRPLLWIIVIGLYESYKVLKGNSCIFVPYNIEKGPSADDWTPGRAELCRVLATPTLVGKILRYTSTPLCYKFYVYASVLIRPPRDARWYIQEINIF